MSHDVLAVTGTPGVGKKTIGALLAHRLGFKLLELNPYATEVGAILGEDEHEFIVDEIKLRKATKPLIDNGRIVIVGHLIPHVMTANETDLVVVLRCHPSELRKRLGTRQYPGRKMLENLGAEVLDEILTDSINRFGIKKVAEFDTTSRDKHLVVEDVYQTFIGNRPPRRGMINWANELSSKAELEEYFNY
jgi:adenylate kinase